MIEPPDLCGKVATGVWSSDLSIPLTADLVE
jgi:hypothetical protein